MELRSPDGAVQLVMRNPVSTEANRGLGDPTGTVGTVGTVGTGATGPSPATPSTAVGLKLDLDVFNQFMDAGKYTLRISVRPLKQ